MSPVPEVPAPGVPAPAVPAPEISVIAPHLNQPALLRTLLASLFAQDFDMGRAEVIVVDNGSRVPPRDVVAEFPGVRLVEERTPGPGPARNRGVALSAAPILAFTDSDCQVDRHWLATILRHFAADPGLDILGGDMRLILADPARPTPVEAYECVYAFPQTLYIHSKGYSVTANMAARRAVLDAVGPFAGIGVSEDSRLGPAGAGHGLRHPLEARRGRAASGAPDHGRAARQVRPQRQPRLHHRGDRARGPGEMDRQGAGDGRLAAGRDSAHPRHRPGLGLARPPPRLPGPGRLPALPFGPDARALVSQEVRTASTRWNRDDRGMAGRDGG